MSEPAGADGSADGRGTRAIIAAAYVVLGSALCWSRFFGLNHGYSSDELMTVRNHVRAGPQEILIGHYTPNNHELFSVLAWVTSSIVGESQVALRLWSAVPFVAGVIVVTAWLHVRLGPLSALLFLFFATASPLLLDITRQARGYGLAFLAMGVLLIAALEAVRTQRSLWLIATYCCAGVAGTLTLPHFGIAFVATGLVLLTKRELRRPVAIGLAASLVTVIAWYAPHLDDLASSSRQDYGAPIGGAWIITAPIDQILMPGLTWIDEVLVNPGPGSLALVFALALLLGASPLLHARDSAHVLGAGTVATVLTFWLTRTNVAPRFFSFLLVPLLMLLATGTAAILARAANARRAGVRALIAVTLLGFVAVMGAPYLQRIPRMPRESMQDVAATIQSITPRTTPVFAHVPYPRDLEFHLGHPVEAARTPDQLRSVCHAQRDAVFVSQPWLLPPLTPDCATRPGVRHLRFKQYARGGEVNVWLIPPVQ